MRRLRQAWPLLAALAFVSANAAAESLRVLPVLSQESGRVEALLLLDGSQDAASARALDRVLTPPASGGLRVQLGGGKRISADLLLDSQPGLALLCRGNIGLAAALGSLGDHCLLADVGATDPMLSNLGRRIGLNTGWQSADGDLDLRFGLAWLDTRLDATPDALAEALRPLGSTPSPLLLADHFSLESQQVNLSGTRRLGDAGWLRVDGSLARTFAGSPLLIGVPLRWDSTALSLEGGYGTMSGRITGRLIEVPGLSADDGSQSSFDIDLGVSWRTPWQAQLTVGARSLLGQPDASQWPLSTLPRRPDAETRAPYVRYHQDL